MNLQPSASNLNCNQQSVNTTMNLMDIYDGMLIVAEFLLLILKVLYYNCESLYRLIVPVKKKNVAGEVVLITGAGHGIGKELAIGYASLGATVVCWDINQENNERTMNEIKNMGKTSVYAYQCDVTDREEIFKVAERVRQEVGDVTILINNAGIIYIRTFQNHNFNEIKRMFDVNIMAHYWMLKAFLPNMIEKDHGHVVAVSSGAGLMGGQHATVYCATKFAVRGLMESLSEEVRVYSKGESSVKFTTVYPTLVHTGFAKSSRIRFSNLFGGLSAQEAASLIIDAQRQNIKEKGIPSYVILLTLLRCMSDKSIQCIRDFMSFEFVVDG